MSRNRSKVKRRLSNTSGEFVERREEKSRKKMMMLMKDKKEEGKMNRKKQMKERKIRHAAIEYY